jgi:hypothetical protein
MFAVYLRRVAVNFISRGGQLDSIREEPLS